MGAEIVIVDDDPIVGNLTTDVLREAGFTTQWVKDCVQAESVIRQHQPRLAVLDIMMPGMDGLSLLRRLKQDPSTSAVKFIVVSGKSFAPDREKALAVGADLFLEKPFDIDSFPMKVSELVGSPSSPEQARKQAPASGLKLQVWGSRGREKPRPKKSKVGLFGPCVLLDTSLRTLVLDAGTGLCGLGPNLAALPADRELWLLLPRAAPEAVDGLKAFAPTTKRRTIKVAGPAGADRGLKDVLKAVLSQAAERTQARFEVFELREESYELAPGVRLSAMYAHHPGPALVLALELEGRKLVYAPDSETTGEAAGAQNDYDDKLVRFSRGADLIIHDAYFTDADYQPSMGHSSYRAALELAKAAHAKELWLINLRNDADDAALERIEADARLRAEAAGFRCRLAREGLSLEL